MVLARADLPSQLSDVHQDLLPAPADNDVGDEENVALDVGFESGLRPVSYLLQLLVARPAANRSLRCCSSVLVQYQPADQHDVFLLDKDDVLTLNSHS
jgi:hypothetical protein